MEWPVVRRSQADTRMREELRSENLEPPPGCFTEPFQRSGSQDLMGRCSLTRTRWRRQRPHRRRPRWSQPAAVQWASPREMALPAACSNLRRSRRWSQPMAVPWALLRETALPAACSTVQRKRRWPQPAAEPWAAPGEEGATVRSRRQRQGQCQGTARCPQPAAPFTKTQPAGPGADVWKCHQGALSAPRPQHRPRAHAHVRSNRAQGNPSGRTKCADAAALAPSGRTMCAESATLKPARPSLDPSTSPAFKPAPA